MESELKYLEGKLPEDIERLKACGQFDQALRVIDRRLEKGVPTALARRLALEKAILRILPEEYPYSYEEALRLLQGAFDGFTEREFVDLWEEDATDWIYREGKPYFKDSIVANLAKTRPHLAARAKDERDRIDREGNFSMLDDTIAAMKRQGALAYRIRIRSQLRIRPEAERAGKVVRVYLPLPVAYAQVEAFRLIDASPAPSLVAPADYPQRTVCFEGPLQAGQPYTVEYEYINRMRYVDPKPEAVYAAQPTFYTEQQPPHVVFSATLRGVTDEVLAGESNPLLRARRIYDFVTTRVMYSFVRPYLAITDIPGYCLTSLKGDCGIQALTFIAMCRYAGVPARWQSGLYANPLSIGNHDWAQFYVAPYGWLYADCSFGGSAYRAGNEERWNFYFGNLEPFRMPACSEFQHPFVPQSRFLRNDPYDNQSGEAEYEDGGLSQDQYDTQHEVVAMERV